MLTKLIVIFALFATTCLGDQIENGRNWRIVGGADAAPGSAPYQVSLMGEEGHFCGGSIVARSTVLTAAHCLMNADIGTTLVMVGSNTLNPAGLRYSAMRFIIHPEFDREIFVNDLGLVIITKTFQTSNLVAPIALGSSFVDGGASATLTGWGFTDITSDLSNNLQYIELKTISLDQCKNAMANINQVFDSQICTLTKEGEGVCVGDSGSPLIVEGKLAGVVSWGNPCAKGYPDVYTRVNVFSNWITSNSI